MVQTWKSEDAEDHVCRNCGARYKVRVTRLPARERDSVHCVGVVTSSSNGPVQNHTHSH